MLKKKNRLTKSEIPILLRQGGFLSSKHISLRYLIDKNKKHQKISFVVPKTIEKTATRRNFIRRQSYSNIEDFIKRLPNGFSGLFIFKKSFRQELNGATKKDLILKIKEEIKAMTKSI